MAVLASSTSYKCTVILSINLPYVRYVDQVVPHFLI